MDTFVRYISDKMTSKQLKKVHLRDLGLAAIDTKVIFT